MKSKKFHIGLGFLLITFMLLSCDNGIVGNGDVRTRMKKIGDFKRIEIQGNFDVFLDQTGAPGLRIEADENIMDIIKVYESGDRLEIRSSVNILRAKKKNLYIQFDDLKELELTGAVEVRSEGKLKLKSLEIYGAGVADVNMDLEADRLSIDVSGAGDFDLSGQVKNADICISGAGGFDLIDLKTEKMTIEISGAAHARVFATEELDVEISGAGAVRYRGNPNISRDVSGIGSLKKY